MAVIIYAMCALTALVCTLMLLAGARRSGSRMLFWSGLCFACLFVVNALVVVDAINLFPQENLTNLRLFIALLAIALLLYGLIFEEE